MATCRENHVVVVAIDLGTTYSGFAYSLRKTFLEDKTEFLTDIIPEYWNSGDLLSDKTPTTLLLDKNENFVSFGYDAEKDYGRMSEEERDVHYYFRRFKMMLYDTDGDLKLTRDTVLKDIRDKELPAIEVFKHSLQYLKERFVKIFMDRNLQITIFPLEKYVTWVLTVPANWNEPAKQFMEEAAERAGISKSSLLICLEPEAVAIFCKWLPIERDDELLNDMKPGCRFLVVDAGGGTIDMAIQEVREDEKLHEIYRAQGGDWEGIYVDAEFKHMLEDIVSKSTLDAFRLAHTIDYIDLFRTFERKKREIQTRNKVTIHLPLSLLEMVAEDNINQHIEDHGLKEQVKYTKGKFQIKLKKYEEFVNKAIDKIVVKIEEMLVFDTANKTNVIIIVGEFSAIEFLQKRIKDLFPRCKVVIPPESGLAVLKGAVLYGYDPDIIAFRMMKYTSGVSMLTTFIKGKTSIKFKVFVSDKDLQNTEEEGCKEIGSLNIPMPATRSGTNRKVVAKFKFGTTNITVEGTDETFNESADIKLYLLEDTS